MKKIILSDYTLLVKGGARLDGEAVKRKEVSPRREKKEDCFCRGKEGENNIPTQKREEWKRKS